MPNNTLIIGAGLTGLSCAHHLKSPYRIIERLPREDEFGPTVGGAARSKKRDAFIFDITGHWLHLRDAEIKSWVERLLPEKLIKIKRRAAIHSHGVTTPYPFQANTHGLPTKIVAECVLGFFAAREKSLAASEHAKPAANFEEYIRATMGDGIAEHFMIPYNTKIWTVPPSQMSFEACKRFVPLPSAEEVVYGAITPGGANHALGYNAEFSYPKTGGIGALALAIEAGLDTPVNYDSGVTKIDWKHSTVQIVGGERIEFEQLVSTMPLDTLCQSLVNPPAKIAQSAAKLRATQVTYWDLGFEGAGEKDAAMWTYFPESKFPFYRVGSPSAAYAELAPVNHRSYYVEYAHARGTECPHGLQDILKGLREAGLVGADEEPVVAAQEVLNGAYVILDHEHEKARDEIIQWLQSVGIISTGRYGAWTYDSMEGALLAGKDAARQILDKQGDQK